MPEDVKKITIETQRPRGSFPGQVEIGYYVVVDGIVVLTDEHGKEVSGASWRRCKARCLLDASPAHSRRGCDEIVLSSI
jgi:hypothetical protein